MAFDPKPGDVLQAALESYCDNDRVRFIMMIGIINGFCSGDENLTRDVLSIARTYGYDRGVK